MRWVVIAALSLAAAPARADSVFDVVGGIAAPVSDSNWTKLVDASPKLGVRFGATGGTGVFGGLVSIDWTPEKSGSVNFGIGTSSYSVHRFRGLASFLVLYRVAPKVTITGRAGIGADLLYTSVSSTLFGTSSSSDLNAGFAFEVGGGAWFDLGSVQLGAELGVPVSTHSDHTHDMITYAGYTSVDIDVLLGVRFRR